MCPLCLSRDRPPRRRGAERGLSSCVRRLGWRAARTDPAGRRSPKIASGAPRVLGILPTDDGDGRAIRLDESQRTEKGHVELAVDWKIDLVVPGIGRFIAIPRGDRRIAAGSLASAHIHLASGQKILTGADMDVWRE